MDSNLDGEIEQATMKWFAAFFLGLFLLLPIVSLLFLGFQPNSLLSLLSDEEFWSALQFTYTQAALSAGLSAVVGIFCAWVWSEVSFRGRSQLLRLNLIFFCLPSLLVALAILSLWGRGGWFSQLSPFGWSGILLGNALLNIPLFIKWVSLALRNRDVSLEKAAFSLGAGRLKAFSVAIWPQIGGAVKNSFVVAFLLSSSNFVLILLLGGRPEFQTLEILVYVSTKVDLNLPRAVSIGIVQTVFSLLIYFGFLREKASGIREVKTRSVPGRWIRSVWIRNGVLVASLVLYGLFCAAPVFALVVQSFQNLSQVQTGWTSALGVSVALGLLVGALSVSVGVGIAEANTRDRASLFSKLLLWFGGLPLAVSSILISLGIFVSWGHSDFAMEPWKLIAVVVVQALLSLPFVWPAILNSWRKIPDETVKAAQSLGATRRQVFFRIELPLLRPALVTSFCLAAGFSFGEVGSVMIFYSQKAVPLSLYLQRLMGQYRFEEAFGVGIILLFATLILLWTGSKWEEESLS